MDQTAEVHLRPEENSAKKLLEPHYIPEVKGTEWLPVVFFFYT